MLEFLVITLSAFTVIVCAMMYMNYADMKVQRVNREIMNKDDNDRNNL
jgi:hypothetical protein